MASADKDTSLEGRVIDLAVNVLGAACLIAAAVVWPLGFLMLVFAG